MIKFYRRYQKYGMDDTRGIEMGKSYVFPKIDGTNAQLWFEGEKILCWFLETDNYPLGTTMLVSTPQ